MKEFFPIVNLRRGDDPMPRPHHQIHCSACAASEIVAAPNGRLPRDQAANHFRHKDWLVNDKGHHLCPSCMRGRAVVRGEKRSARVLEEKTKMSEKPAISVPASVSIVELYMILDDAYDREKKDYKRGHSDEIIAEKTGLAISVVADRREKDFGPLVKDTLFDELAKVEREILDALNNLRSCLSMASAAVKDASELYDRIRIRQANFAGHVAALTKRAK